MRPRGKVFYLLLAATVAVWSVVGIRLYSAWNEEEILPPGETALEGIGSSASLAVPFEYKSDVRDPFGGLAQPPHLGRASRGRLDTMSRKRKELWSPPPYRLTGLIRQKGRKTAVLQGPQGDVIFLHEKDTLSGGLAILRIGTGEVEYRFQRRKGLLTLP